MSIGPGSDSPSDKNRYAALAALLRERREQLGLTRKDVCERTGLSYPYVSQLEGGYRAPSLGTARRLAQVLELAVEDIVVLADDAVAPPRPAPRSAAGRSYANPSYAVEAMSASAGMDAFDPATDAWRKPPSRPVAAVAPRGDERGPTPAARRSRPVQKGGTESAARAAADLLTALPAEARLEALAAVQRRVVESVVRDMHRRPDL